MGKYRNIIDIIANKNNVISFIKDTQSYLD